MSTSIVILASGRGSNFDAILAATRATDPALRLDAEIRAVISDRPEAAVLEKARTAGIPAIAHPFPAKEKGTLVERRARHDEALLETLRSHQPRFLVLAGYMRVMTPGLIEAFRDPRGYSRIVNVHPSLLPAFPGTDAYGQAFRHAAKVTGITIHLVEPAIDSGPICAQEAFSMGDCRTLAEVEQRGLAVEHRLYPATLGWILSEKFQVEECPGGSAPGGEPSVMRSATGSDGSAPARERSERRLCVRPF